ncbi:MAG TPA: mandelate racemase/muconate lactonizing enzyme family protein [Mycobacteriales bacterium]|nr:mandelate racemase/muconate lactonizing enzyme family protein [Mycobacteriales bacterium]
MRIDRVETVPVVAPLAREYRGSHYRMTHRATLIVRLHVAGGLVGEAYVADEDRTLQEIKAVVDDEIAPLVVGRDVRGIEALWELGYRATFDILRDRRIGLVALAGLDTAAWDALGKALNCPLWRLWGGYRDAVPMVVIGGYYGQTDADLVAEVEGYLEIGLAGMKLKVGGLSPAEDAARVETVRKTAGPDFVLTIDANQGYSVADAVELARRCADLDVTWFEEPVRWHNDRRSLRDVRYLGGLPVAAGQSEYTVSGCRDLMEAGAIDFCNFDASWSGGPTAWRRMAAVALAYDVRVAHHEEPHVAAHLIASQPHGTFAECFHPDRDPFWWNLVVNRPTLSGGMLKLPDAPGLGWQLDWDYVAAHRADRE